MKKYNLTIYNLTSEEVREIRTILELEGVAYESNISDVE